MATRRQFLKGFAAGLGAVLSGAWNLAPAAAQGPVLDNQVLVPLVATDRGGLQFRAMVTAGAAPLDPTTLQKYVQNLPLPGTMTPVSPGYYEVGAFPITQTVHPQLPATNLWGYGTDQASAAWPGATFEALRDQEFRVKWTNDLFDPGGLPLPHPLPVDQTLHWADPLGTGPTFDPYTGPVPTVVHVHGGEQRSDSDGHPEAWFTPGFEYTGIAWSQQVYTFPNGQPPTTLWYHDHALGITRLNVFMGLAGFYIIRDPQIESAFSLPSGPYEVPLLIQDRMFDIDGQLVYPDMGVNPDVHPFWMPEFFGDTITVNGAAWPNLDVEPRKYRFRMLNGSNARFYGLSLSDGTPFIQIGTDGGYLSAPGVARRLLVAPAERMDVIIDFTGKPAGTTILMLNDANAPFPNGAPPDPNTTGQIMQFTVTAPGAPDMSRIPRTLSAITPLSNPVVTRTLTLNEVMGPGGPLALFLDGKMWDAPVSETPALGSTEVWEIVNLTGDTHPIHLHLVQFQLLDRQRFRLTRYDAAHMAANPVIPIPMGQELVPVPIGPYLVGDPMPASGRDLGWKDTIPMNVGQVTRIIARWAPIDNRPAYPFDAKAGPGYVWHCHMLEHEDNEMMRPYIVT